MDKDTREALKRELLGYERYGNADRAAQVRKLLGDEKPKRETKVKRETAAASAPETR